MEDDPPISRLIESNLLVAGYEPACAMDGRQALDALAAQRFDLALCDIMLPELDGFALLPHMRARNIPVIFVSAKADVQSRVQGLRLGAEDYLVKPFDILELLVRMEKVLARHTLQSAFCITWTAALFTRVRSLFRSSLWNMSCCAPLSATPAWC